MAYDTKELKLISAPCGGGSHQVWRYEGTDTIDTVAAAGYISNAYEIGMNVGDTIEVVVFTSTAKTTVTNRAELTADAVVALTGSTLRSSVEPATVAVTTTSDGLTTGLIPSGTRVAVITSANANNIATLPTPVVGHEVLLINTSGTGFELRTTSPTTISINGGVAAAAESALASTALLIRCVCISATAWIANSHVAAGTESAVEAAAT